MADYDSKIETIRRSLSDFLKKKTSDIYNIKDCYREFKADDLVFDMSKYYITKFEEEFTSHITSDMRLELGCCGRNIGYALKTFIKLNPHCSEKNLDKFANEFLIVQLDDGLENWFYDLELSFESCQVRKKTL